MSDTHEWAVCPNVIPSISIDDPPHTFTSKAEACEFIGALRDNRLWTKPLEIIRPSHSPDKQQIKTFREYLPPEQVGPVPEIKFDDLFDSAMDEVGAESSLSEPKYYLHDDWNFKAIVKEARHRSGHVYQGRTHNSFAELIVKALYDIEEACLGHYKLTPVSLAQFLRSWQVQDHFHAFCTSVANGPTGKLLLRAYGERHAIDCERAMYVQLAAHAHELDHTETTEVNNQLVANAVKDQIMDLRIEANITIDRLAERVGITPRSVKRHLSGAAEPRFSQIKSYEREFSKLLKRDVVIFKTSPNVTRGCPEFS